MESIEGLSILIPGFRKGQVVLNKPTERSSISGLLQVDWMAVITELGRVGVFLVTRI